MKQEQQSKLLKRANSALLDIYRGHSVLNANGRIFYFKHFSILDTLKMEEEYEKYLLIAKKNGIKTEEELIDMAISQKKWSKAKEESQQSLRWSIDKLNETLKKISDTQMQKNVKASIEGKEKELESLALERKAITNYSAENFAEHKRMKYLLEISCFEDEACTTNLKEEDLLIAYFAFFEKLGELNERNFLLNVAFNTPFFELFSLNYRQPSVLFEKSGLNLTIFQRNLLVYANSLLNKLKSTTIPDGIANDPVKILDYSEETANTKASKVSHGIGDLVEKNKARGGTLKPEDFLT